MLHRFNKIIRILIVLFLIIPPISVQAEETTVTENFNEGEINEDITFVYGSSDTAVVAETDCSTAQIPGSINIEDMDCHGSEYFGSDRYQLGLRSSTDAFTIAFPNSESKPITEVGFLTLAVDDANTGTIYYDDSTSATFNIVANANGNSQVTLTAPSGTTINEIVIAGASDNLQDWWLFDNVYYKYTAVPVTTTTTSSTTTTTTATSSTTTTIPPAPQPEPPPTTTTTIPVVIVEIGGEEVEYTQTEVNDGTVERDQERLDNLEEYGCELTNAQIERGDCDVEIYEEDIYEEEFSEEEQGVLDDSIIIFEISDENELEELEFEDLNEEEIEDLEKQMEIDDKELELLEGSEEILEDLGLILTDEEYEDLTEEEIIEFEKNLEEFIEVVLEIEEYIDDFEDFETIEIIIEEEIDLIDIFIANDLFPPDPEDIEKDLEQIQEEIIEDEVEIEEEIFEDEVEIYEDEEQVEETVFEIFDIFDSQGSIEEELSEEIIEEEVAELEEVIEEIIEIPIVEEDLSEEEVEEVIEEYVEDLETEEVIEVLEEVNDIGVQNLSETTEETQEIIQEVVEEAIEEIDQLTEEQVEVVAEVLQVETEDVEIIAEAVKEDESVATAVEEYVERAVENKDVENYTLADVVTEVQYEEFLENPIEVFVDFDNLEEIRISNIGDDMSSDQREKAQEVVVPVILTRIASMAAFMFRRG